VQRVNRQLCRYRPKASFFICATYLEIAPLSGEYELINAGLSLPWHGSDPLIAKGRPLGFSEKTVFGLFTDRLEPGQALFCHTDGLEDGRYSNGHPVGFDGVRRIVEELAQATGKRAAMATHLEGIDLFDDITALRLARPGEAAGRDHS